MQLRRLPSFIQARIENWNFLRRELSDLEDVLDFMLPTHAKAWSPDGFVWQEGALPVEPSWFGFMMLVKKNVKFTRTDLARALDAAKIGNRMLFGGNLVRQPAFVQLREDTQGRGFRTVGDLAGADRIMNEAIFTGTYPGLDQDRLAYIAQVIRKVAKRN